MPTTHPFDALLDRIRSRIRPVCPNMPVDEFNELTERMAECEYKHVIDVSRQLSDTGARTPLA